MAPETSSPVRPSVLASTARRLETTSTANPATLGDKIYTSPPPVSPSTATAISPRTWRAPTRTRRTGGTTSVRVNRAPARQSLAIVRARAKHTQKKIHRPISPGTRANRSTDRSPRRPSPRLLVSSSPVPLPTPHTKSPPKIFSFFLEKSDFFIPYTSDFFPIKKSQTRLLGDSVVRARFPLSRPVARWIVASSHRRDSTRRRRRRLATRTRASSRVPLVPRCPHRDISNTPRLHRRRKTNTHARSSVIDRVNARAGRGEARHEPSRVPPPPRVPTRQSVRTRA